MPTGLRRDELLLLARRGAHARLAELRQEIAGIKALLGGGTTRRRRQPASSKASAAASRGADGAPTRSWSAAQRKAAAARMRAYWAKRKARKK